MTAQLFLSTPTKVVIIDKTEGNGNNLNIGGQCVSSRPRSECELVLKTGNSPAWATEYDITTNKYRAMDVTTNSFCAGGNVLGNGMWLVRLSLLLLLIGRADGEYRTSEEISQSDRADSTPTPTLRLIRTETADERFALLCPAQMDSAIGQTRRAR